jgi:acetyl esterase/lipase
MCQQAPRPTVTASTTAEIVKPTPRPTGRRLPALQAPLLLLVAGRDDTPVEEVEEFAEQVRSAGVEAELHVYPNPRTASSIARPASTRQPVPTHG